MGNPTDLHANEDRSQAVGRSLHFQGSFESLSACDAGHGDRSVRVARSTTTRGGTLKYFALGGTLKNFILHYHAPRDLEKFRSRSTTTRSGTLKNFILHYHAPRDLEKFHSPLPRAVGLKNFILH